MSVPEIQQREAQPAMVMREEVPLGGIGAALHRILPVVCGHIQELGGTPAGVPTLDALPSSADVQSIVLDGGPCVTLMHGGSYDELPARHAELDEWFETTGHKPAGFRWEAYLAEPGGWRTLITQALEPKE